MSVIKCTMHNVPCTMYSAQCTALGLEFKLPLCISSGDGLRGGICLLGTRANTDVLLKKWSINAVNELEMCTNSLANCFSVSLVPWDVSNKR